MFGAHDGGFRGLDYGLVLGSLGLFLGFGATKG